MINKSLEAIVCVSICLLFGCPEAKDDVSVETFHLSTNKLIEKEDLVVQTATIETSGSRVIQLRTEDGIKRYSTFRPNGDSNMSRFEIVFVATLTKTPASTNVLKWIIQAGSDSGAAYMPSTYNVKASEISEVLRLDLRDGSYSFGQDLNLGEFQTKPFSILVE